MLLVNGVLVPLLVQVPPVVGLAVMLQQTPSAVTDAPPFEVTVPPLVAVVEVIALAAVVLTVGIAKVVNVRSLP